MTIAYNCLLFLLFPVIALCGTKFYGRDQFAQSLFPREASLFWRGIAALMVVFAHLTIYLEEEGISVGPAVIFDWVGGMGVLLFFFVSGYGTTCSTRKVDLKWLISHILRLWIPVTLLRIIFYFGYRAADHAYDFASFILYAIGIDNPAWFIAVMLSIYVTVYIAKRFFSSHYIIALLVLNLLTSTIFLACGFSSRWYNGHLVFVFGAWLALYGHTTIPILRKQWGMCLVVFAGLFFVCGFGFAKLKPQLISAPIKLIAGMALSMVIVVISQKILKYGRIMCFVGSASLYIYIIHQDLYEIMRQECFALSPWLVVFGSISIAMGLSFACVKLQNMVKQKQLL